MHLLYQIVFIRQGAVRQTYTLRVDLFLAIVYLSTQRSRSTTMTRVVNATPPADFPHQVIVMDRHIAKRYPEKAIYLRLQKADHQVEVIDLEGALTLAGAREMARSLGHSPTHWIEIHEDNDTVSGPSRLIGS